MSGSDSVTNESDVVIVLDYLPHGPSGDNRPQYEKSAIGYGLSKQNFQLYEFTVSDDSHPSIGDTLSLSSAASTDDISSMQPTAYENLSSGARAEMEYVVRELVEENEQRFVDFYNNAQPITLRLHQLNLLPGIGQKLRDNILDGRKRKPFSDFDDLKSRVSGLHNPVGVIVERILDEIKDDSVKYKVFVKPPETD